MSAGGYSDPRLSRPDPGDVGKIREYGAMQASRPIVGAGMFNNSGFAGQVLHTRKPRRVAMPSPFPFKVFLTGSPDKGYKRGVYFESLLFKSRDTVADPEPMEITGLLGSLSPASDDGGWAETGEDDFLWLDVGLAVDGDTGVLTADNAQIHSDWIDGDWEAGAVQHDGGAPVGDATIYTPLTVRLVLAKIVPVDGGGVRVAQRIMGHRVLEQTFTKAYSSTGEDPQYVTTIFPFPL